MCNKRVCAIRGCVLLEGVSYKRVREFQGRTLRTRASVIRSNAPETAVASATPA